MDFLGFIKSNVEFPWMIKKNSSEISKVLVLDLKISEGCNTICGVSRGEALFCVEFPGVK